MTGRFTVPLTDIGREDTQRFGGKGANLGELVSLGVRVPAGFVIASEALDYLLEANAIGPAIADIAAGLNMDDLASVEADTARIRELISGATIPLDLDGEIRTSYRGLVSEQNPYVAVRSSVAVKDSTISSFPGMMDTYHYVLGEDDVVARVRECWASLWTGRAAFARFRQGIAHDRGLIAAVVQLMINADIAGVLFTANPINGALTDIVIESNWGIGESVVSGRSMNDFFIVDKATLVPRERRVARKNLMVTMDRGRGSGRVEQPVPAERASEPTLSDVQLAELGATAKRVEAHFEFPVDMEWAYQAGTLHVLQARRIRHLGGPQ